MIEQQARVLSLDGSMAVVQVGRTSGCAACDAGRGCGAGLFGRLNGRKPVTLALENTLEVRPGQVVQLGLPESVFLIWVAKLYGLPLLAGLFMATISGLLAARMGLGHGATDALVFLSGVLSVTAALIFANRTTKPDIRTNDIQLYKCLSDVPGCGTPDINE